MQIQITAAECCTRVTRGVKAEVLEHLKAEEWSGVAVSVTDPDWTNEPCDMMLSDLRQMGFTSLMVIYGVGPRQRFAHAL